MLLKDCKLLNVIFLVLKMKFLVLILRLICLQLFVILINCDDSYSDNSENQPFNHYYGDQINYDNDFNCQQIELGSSTHGVIKNGSQYKCWVFQSIEDVPVFITVKFSYFSIPGPNCLEYSSCDVMYSRNYLSLTSSRLDAVDSTRCYCGVHKPPYNTFYANQLKMHLYQNSYSLPVGFQMEYNTAKVLHSNVVVTTYRFLSSFDYPHEPPPNSMMSWNVSLDSVQSFPLQLIIEDWSVSEASTLTVYDGPGSDYKIILRLNGFENYNNLRLLSTGPFMFVELDIGAKNYGDFRLLSGFNATVKLKGYCLPGTSSCGDGLTCYSDDQRCNNLIDCLETGFDERGCDNCKADEFSCGSEGICYPQSERCNGKPICQKTKRDENDCTSCAPGCYHCSLSNTCIYEMWRCDGQKDCRDYEDEENCHFSASRRVITAAIVGCLVCGLLLAIALGCSCKLYTLRSSAHRRHRRNRFLQTTSLGRIARELLQREAPPSYSMTVDGVEATTDSRRRSSSSRRRRDRRRRRRNREPRIRRAQPLVSGQNNAATEMNNRDDSLLPNNSAPTDLRVPSSSTSTADTEPSSAAPPTELNVMDMTAYVLAEIGLATYPTASETSSPDSTPSLPAPEESNAAQCSNNDLAADADQQAAPLPKKVKIRPVMVEAPFNTVMVDDIPACVYPNPPSYHEAVSSGDAPKSSVVIEEEIRIIEKTQPATSSSKDFFSKFWPKTNAGGSRDFPKILSFQNIFNTGQGSSNSFPNTSENDRVQLITSESNQVDVDDDGSSEEVDDSAANLTLDSGSVAFELESYSVTSTLRETSSMGLKSTSNEVENDVVSDDVSLLSLSENASISQDSNLLDLTIQI